VVIGDGRLSLRLGDKRMIHDPQAHPNTIYGRSVHLEASVAYPFTFEYRIGHRDAKVRVLWLADELPFQTMPRRNFYTRPPCAEANADQLAGLFRIDPRAGGSPLQILPGKRYQILNAATRLALDAKAEGHGEKSRCRLEVPKPDDLGQQWTFEPGGDGAFSLRNIKNHHFLDGNTAEPDPKVQPVIFWNTGGAPWQQWLLVDNGDGTVKLLDRDAFRALDLRADAAAGAELIRTPRRHRDDARQRWILKELPEDGVQGVGESGIVR
jgi:hypothetical protein